MAQAIRGTTAAANSAQQELLGAPRRLLYSLTRWPLIPGVVLVAWIVAAIFGPVISPHDPFGSILTDRNAPPFWYTEGSFTHILGADPIGRDVLSRIIAAARIELMIVAISVTTGMLTGTFLGLITGYFRGFLDELIVRLVDIWASVPFLLFAIVVIVAFGKSFPVLIALFILVSWTGAIRLVRAEVMSLSTRDYVALAKVAGASHWRILYKHLLPGVMNIVIVTATLQTGSIILTESALSFLGVGIPPPNPAWGSMIAEGREYINDAWWVTAFPGIALFLVVMAGNFFGDWLRDRLDPRLRQV